MRKLHVPAVYIRNMTIPDVTGSIGRAYITILSLLHRVNLT